MATNTTTASLDKIASLLGIEGDELSSLLHAEFKTICADPIESKRISEGNGLDPKIFASPSVETKRTILDNTSAFVNFALEKIEQLAANQKHLEVLRKLIHRDEPRKFYFYPGELEAISRILFVIENAGNFQLNLDNLDLYTLPPILQRTRYLQNLSISNNKLQNISLVASLPELKELIANDNQITSIEFLKDNHKLQVLCLNRNNIKTTYEVLKTMPALRELELAGNRINDTLVRPILENLDLNKVVLADNPINAPLNILNDIGQLRAHFRIDLFPSSPSRAATASTTSEPNASDQARKQSVVEENIPGGPAAEYNAPSEAHAQFVEENMPDGPSPESNAPNEAHKQSVIFENTTGEPNPGYHTDANGNDFYKGSQDAAPNPEPNAPEPEHEQTIVEENIANEPGPKSKDDQPPPETKQPSGEEKFTSYAIREIQLRGNPKDNLLDIEKLSGIFYNLIANSDSNGEHFFGLFGRWGRGKTFFWKYILNNKLDHEKYIPIEFHAWKYQDTPGIWAYLYNTLNDAYLGDKPKWYQLSKWLKYYKKILLLNEQRGKLAILVGFILSIAIAVGIYFYNDFFKGNETVQTVLRIGIPVSFISMLIYIAKTFKTDARKIMLALTSNVNFNSQLGFQHEIQQELKYLLQAWISEKEKINKRIFLFIDDIDRCSEDKIIQIVDYIRVLLHCSAIQDRVTVLAAIDERILLHAIQDKYKDFIANKDNDATYKELCREYMDKLFLAGLKLGPLTEYEKRQIVEGFTSNDTAAPDVVTPPASNGISSNKVAEIISHTDNKESVITKQETTLEIGDIKVAIPQAGMLTSEPLEKDISPVHTEISTTPVEPKPIASTARKEFPYEKWEQEFIKDILARNTESTPRSIRVYTYRYLLGKQLVEKSLTEGKISWSQWYNTKEAKQCFAIKLLHYGFKSDTEHLIADYRNFISKYDEKSSFKESIYGYEISLNQELGSIMFQVLTMIIAY